MENDLIYLILFNICKKKMVETYQHTDTICISKKKNSTDFFKIEKDSEGILTLKTGVWGIMLKIQCVITEVLYI